MNRYMRICCLISRMRSGGTRTREMASLKSELAYGRKWLDNLLYENLGLSGEDIVALLQKGERTV